MKRHIISLSLGIFATPLTGCGSLKPSHKAHDGGSKASATAAAADASAASAMTFKFTAAYQQRPIDVFVIRDGNTRADPMDRHLQAAAPVLGARLWNLGDVHVGVFDHYYVDNDPNDANVPPPTATPIATGDTQNLVLKAEELGAAQFSDALELRLDTAGSRGGTPLPASVLLAALTESQRDGGGNVAGLFRPEAFWAVLYVGATENPADPFDADDVMTAMKDHVNGFSVSTLAPDRAGCTFVGLDPPKETNPKHAPQRNLEIKLQELTGGLFGSICEKTFALFMDDFASLGTGTAYFPVTLPAAVKPETIHVYGTGNVEVKEFRYVPGSTMLEVSTKIEPGEAFQISAVPLTPVAAPVVGADPGDNVPQAGEDQLPPEQLAFLKNFQPALQSNCGGCHGNRPFSINYSSANSYRTEIARRVQLPVSDRQRMPQNGVVMSDADLAAIMTWAGQ